MKPTQKHQGTPFYFTRSDIVYMHKHLHVGINNQTVVDMNAFIYYTENVLNNRLLN